MKKVSPYYLYCIRGNLAASLQIILKYTGWLRKECLTGQNAISLQPEEFTVSKFQVLLRRGLLTILKNLYEKALLRQKLQLVYYYIPKFGICRTKT